MNARVRKVAIYGNCQAGWLSQQLSLQTWIQERFEIVYVATKPVSPLFEKLKEKEYSSQFSHVLWQTAAGTQVPEFVPFLSPNSTQLRFPTLCIKWLWPLHLVDHSRNVTEPDFPDGRFPYGDRLLMQLIQKGVPPGELYQEYISTDLNRMIPLDRFRTMAENELKYNDQQSDFQVANLIASTFAAHPTFSAVNHPNPIILQTLLRQIMEALVEPGEAAPKMNPPDLEDILGHQEIPLHPQVAAHFGVKWIGESHRWRYGAKFLTLQEYVEAYGSNTAIFFQESPRLYLERVNAAISEKKFNEAERLLLKALTQYPQVPEFLHGLSQVYGQQKRWEDSERVCRYSLKNFAHVADFHLGLGIALFQQGFPDAALESMKKADQLAPHQKRIQQALELTLRAVRVRAQARG